jgi:hypothetical protein
MQTITFVEDRIADLESLYEYVMPSKKKMYRLNEKYKISEQMNDRRSLFQCVEAKKQRTSMLLVDLISNRIR